MGTLGIGTETDLYGGQYGRFAGAVLAVDEVDVATELDGEFSVTHEVFDGYLGDDAGFGGFVGGVGVAVGDGGADGRGGDGAGGRGGAGSFGVVVIVIMIVVVFFLDVVHVFFGAFDSFGGGHGDNIR